jgi:hypothetical protein
VNRNLLSLKLGILGGIVWGLFFTAYYSMLPDVEFALLSATVCFVAIIIFSFVWPLTVRAFKDAAAEGKRNREREKY